MNFNSQKYLISNKIDNGQTSKNSETISLSDIKFLEQTLKKANKKFDSKIKLNKSEIQKDINSVVKDYTNKVSNKVNNFNKKVLITFKFITAIVVFLIILGVARGQDCNTLASSASNITNCDGLGNCRIKNSVLAELNLGDPEFSCFDATVGGTNIKRRYKFRISRSDTQAELKYEYTSALWSIGSHKVTGCKCYDPFSTEPITVKTCSEPFDLCVTKEYRTSVNAEGNIFSKGTPCILSGPVSSFASVPISFKRKYAVFSVDKWFTKVTLEEEVSNGNNTVDIKAITWTPEQRHIFIGGEGVEVRSIIQEKVDIKDLTDSFILVDLDKPWIVRVAKKDLINRKGEFNMAKFGYFQHYGGIYHYNEAEIKRHLNIHIWECGNNGIQAKLNLNEFSEFQELDHYLGKKFTLYIPENPVLNSIHENDHLYTDQTNNIINPHDLSDKHVISYLDPQDGVYNYLIVNTTIPTGNCKFTIQEFGLIKQTELINIMSCYLSNGEYYYKHMELSLFERNNQCFVRYHIPGLVVQEIGTDMSIQMKLANGNITESCKPLSFKFSNESTLITAGWKSYLPDYQSSWLATHYTTDTKFLVNIQTDEFLKFISVGDVFPEIEKCYVNTSSHRLVIAARSSGVAGEGYLFSEPSGFVQSGFHPLDTRFKEISAPIIKHWSGTEVKVEVCFKDKCANCNTKFTEVYDDIQKVTEETFEKKFEDFIFESQVGSLFRNFKTSSIYTWSLVIVIIIVVTLLSIGLMMALFTITWNFIKPYILPMFLIFYPFLYLFRQIGKLFRFLFYKKNEDELKIKFD